MVSNYTVDPLIISDSSPGIEIDYDSGLTLWFYDSMVPIETEHIALLIEEFKLSGTI